MADGKNFDATSGRIARARREGDLPRSADAVAVASFSAATCATVAALRAIGDGARHALADAAAGALSLGPYLAIASATLAVVVAAIAGALLATYLQTRAFVLVAPAFKPKKLDPVAGLRRMFGREAALGALKATVVSCAVVAAIVPVVRDAFAASVEMLAPSALAQRTQHQIFSALATAVAVGGGFAALDVLLEREKWRRRLKMSFDEVKRDHKQSEGDPQLRGRRRQAHRALARGAIGRVREAAFVVTNPTHLAIALAYDPPRVNVPCVLVRAADAAAASVRAEARRLGIPLIEHVALARSLYAATGVGDAIPREAYVAVAEIVATLGRLDRARAGR